MFLVQKHDICILLLALHGISIDLVIVTLSY